MAPRPPRYMTLLCLSGMNGLEESGRTRAGVPRRVRRGPQPLGHSIGVPLQGCEVEPGHRLLAIPPDPLQGGALWTSRRPEHQAPGRGEAQACGGMGPAGIKAQARATRGARLGARGKAALTQLRVQRRQCQEEPGAGPGLSGAIAVAPVDDVGPGAERLDAPRREALAADRQEADPACVLAAHPAGTKMGRGERVLAVGLTGRLEGRHGRRGGWWAWAAPLDAWP